MAHTFEQIVNAFGLKEHMAYWVSGGFLLIPIALVNFGIWFYFIRTCQMLARAGRQSKKLEPVFHELKGGATPASILDVLSGNKGLMANVISVVMQDVLQGGRLLDVFENRKNELVGLLRKDVVVLAALTSAAPLLGLLGTVMGMIDTFDAVSAISGDTGSKVAGGISQALITTQFGLIVSVPGIFGIAYIRRMVRNVTVQLAECRSHIVAALESTGEK